MGPAISELLPEERRGEVMRVLGIEGKLRAAELAVRLGVSLDTVRRDLAELEARGRLRRVHGGALPVATPGPPRFADRVQQDVDAKEAIASAAVGLVHTGEVIALSGGSTVLAFARRLPDDLEATVVATNPEIVAALADHTRLTVDVVGGRLHPRARTVTGPMAVDALRSVRPDVCVFSSCTLHPALGVTLREREEAIVVRTMLEGSARKVNLSTTAKLGASGPYPVTPVAELDVLVTDAGEAECEPYRALGLEVIRV
jgi:DeoR/GlpR family transcriptional regulator of sugar metabolism